MSKNIDVKSFIKDYCQTLEQDSNNQFYIKIYLKDYEELSLFRAAIINAIEYAAGLDSQYLKGRLPLTIHYLSHILQNIELYAECQGLTTLFENE